QHVDVDMGAVHVLEPRLRVPVDLGADRRQRVLAAWRKRLAAVLHFGARRDPERIAYPERATGLDLLDHRGGAAEQRVAVTLRLLPNARLEQDVERRAVFGVEVVLEELVGALTDMRVHVDDGVAVIGHSRTP